MQQSFAYRALTLTAAPAELRCTRLPTRAFPSPLLRAQRSCGLQITCGRRRIISNAQGDEYFDEGAAQVKRLLDRDRKELLNENERAEYDVEDERPRSSSQSTGSSTGSSNGASTSQSLEFDEELSSMRNPMRQAFKTAPKRGTFGSSPTKSPFGSESDGGSQRDMWASMEPIEDEDDRPWWKQITFGQVAIVFSFVLIIGLMLGTAWVTVKLGGVHFNE